MSSRAPIVWAVTSLLLLFMGLYAFSSRRASDTQRSFEKLARSHREARARIDSLARELQLQERRLQELQSAAQRAMFAARPREELPFAPASSPTQSQEIAAALEQLRTELYEELDRRSATGIVIRRQPGNANPAPREDPIPAQGLVVQPRPVTTAGSNPGALNWDVDQMLGPPDTFTDGDQTTAWASRDPDAGIEWLEVDFPRAVRPEHVLIRETFNPGAVVRVEVLDPDGNFKTIWRGHDPTEESPGDFLVPYNAGFATRTVKITLDTTRVSGWNEIDAIGLVLADGSTDWAEAGDASSSYAENFGQ